MHIPHTIRSLLLTLAACSAAVTTFGQGRPFLGAGAQVAENFDWTTGGTVLELPWVQNSNQSWARAGTSQIGWYASFNSDPSQFAISNGTTNTGGRVLSNFFYTSGDLDRSLGGRPTGSNGPLILALRLTNTSDQTLTGFSIGYAAEVTQQRDASVSNTFVFGYSLEATEADWRSVAFVEPGSAFNATTPLVPVASNVNGNSARTVIAAQAVDGIEWLPGTDLWLRWIAPNVANGPNLGLDDVVFTAFGAPDLPPAMATNLEVKPTAATTLELTWVDNSSDETGFRVERKTGDGAFATITTTGPGATLFRDQNLAPGFVYTYRVIAVKDSLAADPSNEASWNLQLTTPSAPAAFSARVISFNTIELRWERTDYNATAFEIQRYSDGAWQPLVTLTDLAARSYVDTGLPEGTTFAYRIRSSNAQGGSEWQLSGDVTTELFPEVFTTGADPIDESQIAVILHADPVNGDNTTGDGSAAKPFRTIEKTLDVAKGHNAAGLGVKIILQPGTYLEGDPNRDVDFGAVILSGYWTTTAPLIIEGAGWQPGQRTDDVIITGAEEWSDWSAKDSGGVQTKVWPYNWGLNPRAQTVAPDVIKRLELLWVYEPANGWKNYIQTLGPNDTAILNNLSPSDGYFWIDEVNDTISVRPPDGIDLNDPGVIARVTTRKRLMHHWRPQISTSLTPFAIRNVVFEHSGDIALYFQNVRHITIEDCLFRRNKIDGLSNNSFGDARWTLRRSEFHDNGVSGFTGGGNHFLAEDIDVHGNGRLAYLSNYTGWANEGFKIAEMRNSSLRRFRVWDNWGVGMWFDTGIYMTEVVEAIVWNNRSSGTFIENNNSNTSPGLGLTPTLIIRDSLFFDNLSAGTGLLGRGIAIGESENVFIDNTVVVDNEFQVAIANNVRGSNFNTVISNSLIGAGTPTNNGLFLPRNGLGDWQDLFDTLDVLTNDNVYVMNSPAAFTGRNGEMIGFSAWQQAQFNNPLNTKADKAVDSRSTFVQADYDRRPLVNVFAAADAVSEGDVAAPALIITRIGPDFDTPHTVDLLVTTGQGYFDPAGANQVATAFPTSVTIPAGDLSVTVPLSAAADGLVEGRQVLEVTIVPQSTAYTTQPSARIVVFDADVPAGANEVYLEPVATLREGGAPVTVTATRLGDLDNPLTVALDYAGDAVAGVDYVAGPASITFAAGSASASFALGAIDDALPELSKALVVSIAAAQGGANYIAVPPATRSIVLEDNDAAVLGALDRAVAAGEGEVILPLTLTNPGAAPVTYTLRWPNGEWVIVDSRQDGGIAYDWIDIATSANRLSFTWNGLNDDGYTAPLPLGFGVNYYGTQYDSVAVNSNGFMTFGPLQNFTRRYSIVLQLPNTSLNTASNMVAPFWDDFSYAGANAGAYFKASSDAAVVTWSDVAKGSNLMTFQSVIRPQGVVKFQYNKVGLAVTPSAGIQNADRTAGISLAFGEAYAEAGFAVALVPNHAWIDVPEFPLTLAPGESRELLVRVNPDALDAATYCQVMEILSDNPAISTQRLPIELTVSDQWLVPDAGWIHIDWIGWIHSGPDGWFYHPQLGYLYAAQGTTASSLILYSMSEGWLWTTPAIWPWAYSYSTGAWR